MSSELLNQVQKLEGKKLIIVGDVGVDEYVVGDVRRISPEAPVPVLEAHQEEVRPGLSTNVAQNVSALGGIPLLVSVVGKDLGADTLRDLLAKSHVSSEHLIVDENRPTIRKLRVMAQHHHIVRVDFEKKQYLSAEIEAKVEAKVRELMPEADGVVLQDYAKGVLTPSCIEKVIRIAHENGKKVLVDPYRSTPPSFYAGADLMTPNNDEAVALSGLAIDDLRQASENFEEVGQAIMKAYKSPRLVVTRGKDGMSLFEDGNCERVPTFARQVFDVTGAGDTVIATLSLGWVSGLTLKDSCLLANHAAGVVVAKIGCVPCTKEDLLESIESLA